MIDVINNIQAFPWPVSNIKRRLSIIFNILLPIVPVIILSLDTIKILHAAEDTIRGSTATTMPHPELMPMGIHTGGYLLFPSLSYAGSFDDNVFATDSNKKSSYVSEITPAISARSDWNNHALNFIASSNIGINHTFPSEDYVDWDINTDGKLDILHDAQLFAGAGVGHDHVPRTAPNDVRGLEPTTFDKASFFTRYTQSFGRITGSLNLNVLKREYQDVPAIRLGVPTIIDNSDRDRTQYTLNVRGGYQNIGDEQIFIQIRYFQRDYDKLQNFTQIDRSSTGLETSVGTSFDFGGTLLGELSIGYRTQDYQDPLVDINTPIATASIQWNITDLTTTSFNLDRDIRETINPPFSGYISTTSVLSLDHELRRKLLLNLSLLYRLEDYVGIPPADRDDRIYDIIAGSTYKMNRNLHFSIRYHYYQRKSESNTTLTDSTRFDFIKNLITLQINAQY